MTILPMSDEKIPFSVSKNLLSLNYGGHMRSDLGHLQIHLLVYLLVNIDLFSIIDCFSSPGEL